MYIQFNDDWRKEVSKFSIELLKTLFPDKETDFQKYETKNELIAQLRLQLIVKQFNDTWCVKCQVFWRPFIGAESEIMTIRQKAFISPSNQAVAFFEERSVYCCIEPDFIDRDGYSYQFTLDDELELKKWQQ
jgi:hypothetical protein